MTTPTPLPLLLLTLATTQACGVDTPPDAPGDAAATAGVPVQIEDSAGVRIVTYEGTPTTPPAFRLSTEPRYRHGANPGARANMAAYGASIGRSMPLFAAPFADDEGRVWLPSYKAGGELKSTPPYTVIGPDGEWLGMVEAPPGFRILDVAGGLVLGVELDEMDVESVVVYGLVGR